MSGNFDFGDVKIEMGSGSAGEVRRDAPFYIGVLGDFQGTSESDGSARLARGFIEVDRDNQAEVFQKMSVCWKGKPSADLPEVTIQFQSIDDFDPDSLFRRLDVLAELRDLRSRLERDETYAEAADIVASWDGMSPTEEPTATEANKPDAAGTAGAAEEATEDALGTGSLLDQAVAATEETSGDPDLPEALQNLIRDTVAKHARPTPDKRKPALLQRVDSEVQATVRHILHDPQFQRLESIWRCTEMMIRRVATDSRLKLFIWNVCKEDLVDDVNRDNDLCQSTTYDVLVQQTVGTPGGTPWSLLATNFSFGPQDAVTAGRLAKICSVAGTAMLANADDGLVGLDPSSSALKPQFLDDAAQDEVWQRLRQLPDAAQLGLVWPRFIARLPYGKDTRPTERFKFEEFEGAEPQRLLWGSSAILVAMMIGVSAAQGDVGTAIRQRRMECNRLPLYTFGGKGDRVVHPCGAYLLTEKLSGHVESLGVIPLRSVRDLDQVQIRGLIAVNGKQLRGPW